MTPLRKFARLDRAERRLFVEAAMIVPVVRVALTVLPFRIVQRGIDAMTRRMHRANLASVADADQIAWAVTAVSARVPRASCLTQALAATLLLVRYGHTATLRVGVAKNDDGSLRAHAWLESGGRTILGEPAPGTFTPFPVALSER